MSNIHSVFTVISAGFLACIPLSAAAADGDWALCTHAGWGAEKGYEYILSQDTNDTTADGATCRPMGAYFETAQQLSCQISVERPGNRWAVRQDAGGGLVPLTCG